MNSQQREEVERRVLALVRDRLDECDEWYPDGYEIGDFIFLYQILIAPDRDSPPEPWHGGAYAGWDTDAQYVSGSPSWWIDESLFREAYDWLRQTRYDKWKDERAEAKGNHDEDSDDD